MAGTEGKTKEYVWAANRQFRVPAQVVGNVIDGIIERDGTCEAKALVAEAARADSPIHGLFDSEFWDDKYAAQRYREEAARKVINSIRVVIEDVPKPVPAYVSVKMLTEDEAGHTSRKRGYKDVISVMSDSQAREELLAQALKDIRALEERYASLTQLAPVWRALREVAAA